MMKYVWILIVLCLPIVLGGTWVEPTFAGSAFCSGTSYVMCAEQSPLYDPVQHTPPYTEDGSVTASFCAITQLGNKTGFAFVGVPSLFDLKNSPVLASEVSSEFAYDGVLKHWDENCNGDELFEQFPSNSTLDLTRFKENGVVYDVEYDEANIDDFDILDCGTCSAFIQGNVTDAISGMPLDGVNVTLYFKNSVANFEPYMEMVTSSDGSYNVVRHPRDITTNFGGSSKTYSDVEVIPRAQYILVAKHPFYEDYISDVVVVAQNFVFDFSMQPFGVCQSDCTYEGSNLCRKECQGRNGCEFSTLPDGTSLVNELNLLTSNLDYRFFHSSGDAYKGTTCEGDFYLDTDLVDDTLGNLTVTCPPGKSSWTTERLVRYQGQVVKMLVTYCE